MTSSLPSNLSFASVAIYLSAQAGEGVAMSKSFTELSQQLSELAETINRFESEAVQLRIVELLFTHAVIDLTIVQRGTGNAAGRRKEVAMEGEDTGEAGSPDIDPGHQPS